MGQKGGIIQNIVTGVFNRRALIAMFVSVALLIPAFIAGYASDVRTPLMCGFGTGIILIAYIVIETRLEASMTLAFVCTGIIGCGIMVMALTNMWQYGVIPMNATTLFKYAAYGIPTIVLGVVAIRLMPLVENTVE